MQATKENSLIPWNPAKLISADVPVGFQPLQFPEADDILYTDGSSVHGEQGQHIGAGVYCKRDDLWLTIAPCGVSATNTITWVELVAILAALQQRSSLDCTIATDSLACMFSIGNALQAPSRCAESPHKTLLLHISQVILRRANQGLKTFLFKVKSHIGIEGNEIADELANVARDPAARQLHLALGSQAFEDHKWPHLLKKAQDAGGVERRTWRTATDLKSSIRTHVAARNANGLTPAGQYHGSWEEIRTLLHPSSFAFWHNSPLPFGTKVNILKARWGQLWTKKKAFLYKMQYRAGECAATDSNCPVDLWISRWHIPHAWELQPQHDESSVH